MLRKTSLRFVALALLAAAFPLGYLAAQDAPDSVADAARRARQKKEAASNKPATVITNDTIPTAPNDITIPGASNVPAAAQNDANAPAAASGDKDTPSGASSNEDAAKKAAIDDLKKQVKDKEHAVSLLQRELALDKDSYYGRPDYQNDTTGKQKLDDKQANLIAQQNQLNDLKAKLLELAGADALKEPPPSTNPAQPKQQ